MRSIQRLGLMGLITLGAASPALAQPYAIPWHTDLHPREWGQAEEKGLEHRTRPATAGAVVAPEGR